MLKLARVSAADGDHTSVHMELSDDGYATLQLRPEGLWWAPAETQETN